MQAPPLESKLLNFTLANAGVEHRDYLGMSAIGRCPLSLYREMIQGRQWTTQGRLYCERGYAEEQRILVKLAALDGLDVTKLPLFPFKAFRDQLDAMLKSRPKPGDLGPSEIFSDFGGMFQGHSDGSWEDTLLEIKSTMSAKLPVNGGQIMHGHFWQAQCYMYYSGYRWATMIYVARDTGEIRVARVRYNERRAEMCRIRAAEVLEALERKRPPECVCGRCG